MDDHLATTRVVGISELTILRKFGYSVGHVLNDLTSALWFSWFLPFMTLVLQFNNRNSGILMLIGQIADGLSTVFIGFNSTNLEFCGYGKKKSWHLLGTFCVLISFPLIFNQCFFCQNTLQSSQMIYYISLIVLFQFGWAAVQISHLSLIPILTPISNERVGLNSLRYTFTVISNISVNIITLVYFHNDENSFGPKMLPVFTKIIIIVISIGIVFSFIFHIFTKEYHKIVNTDDNSRNLDKNDISHIRWNQWFLLPQFYAIILLYTCTRLTNNLTQVYIPFYLLFFLDLPKVVLASIILVIYFGSLQASFVFKVLDKLIGKKWTFTIATFIAFIPYLTIYYIEGQFFKTYGIYIVAEIIGLTGSAMIISSLGIINDLIGTNTSSGTFVFGILSFFDKIFNGLAVMIISHLHSNEASDYRDGIFFRNVLTFVCIVCLILGLISVISLFKMKFGKHTLIQNSLYINQSSSSDSDLLVREE